MDVGAECRSRLEALALEISDSKQTLESLRWGMKILSEMQRRRAGSISRGEIEPDDNAAQVGEKRRAVEALDGPSKFLKLAGGELSMDELLQSVERGELGEWMAKRVAAQVNSPDTMALVKLIDHCLLLGLDQLPGDSHELHASKAGALSEDQRHHWLALCMASEILLLDEKAGDAERIEFPELAWLLAYFTASHPDVFLPVLLDELLVLQDSATLHHYVRQAAILEFASQSSSDCLASAISTLLQSYEAGAIQKKVRHWIVQSTLCPNFLTLVARVLSPDLNVESAKLFWRSLLDSDEKLVPVPGFWTSTVTGLSDAKAWTWILITKHLELLSPIAPELVLFLYEVDPGLLDWLNKRLSILTDDLVNGKSLFLQTLMANLHRLWDNLSRYLLVSCACSSSSLWECRKCVLQDKLLQTCQIVLLRAEDDLVAELLANSTMHTELLPIVVRLMHLLVVISRENIFKLWAERLADRLSVLDSNQVLKGILAIRQISDDSFWEAHVGGGTAWRAARSCLCYSLNQNWLKLLALVHKNERHDISSNTLGLLHFLSLERSISPEWAAEHLKGALALFLHHLRETSNEKTDPGNDLREFALVRKIVAELACQSAVTFALLVNILLDVSFEACVRRQVKTTSSCSCELSNSVSKPSSQMTVSPAASRLDRYGKLKLVFAPPFDANTDQRHLLSDENCYRSPGGVLLPNRMTAPTIVTTAEEKLYFIESTFPEMSGLLIHSTRKSMGLRQSKSECWSGSHPAEVLAQLLADRLATPYEFSMTVEQYEEILPRHVVTVRHTFLMDLFRQNPLLFTALELIMEHGETKELESCTEFVRALLADCISQWHCSMRTQQALNKLMAQDTARMQVYNVIQLVNSARWLPQPLASCGEIISLIRPEDIKSLLFLIWRCMHDNLKRPVEGSRVKSEETSLRDWRGQFLGILRHNISRIGAHLARLYPQF